MSTARLSKDASPAPLPADAVTAEPVATEAEQEAPAPPANKPKERTPGARLAALDAFRGLTILIMLLVNNVSLGEATPRHLTHAEWTGRVHLADVVFPWFLLAVGTALPFSMASHRRKGGGWFGYFVRALRRTVALVALGWLVDSTVNHSLTLGLGVLQVIGLAYFVAALLAPLRTRWRLLIAVGLLIAHSAILLVWHVPIVGPGIITEGKTAVDYLNETILAPWGLRGVVSVIPTAAMVLIGSALGDLMRSERTVVQRSGITAAAGAALLLVGLLTSIALPMNKPLWTASYILYTAGLGAILLAALHVGVDGTKHGPKFAFPLLVPGANAITAYVAPILIKINILQTWTVSGTEPRQTIEGALQAWCYQHAGRINGGWLYTGGYLALSWLLLYYLYRKQWFLRV